MERMVEVVEGSEYQSLHHFLSASPWDATAVMGQVAMQADAALGGSADSGIRAVENYGFEASDCTELYREIRGNAQWHGYCFYHNQDLVRAVLGGGLAVRFSAAVDRPSDDDNRAIGETIVDVLRTHGLQPEWDGDPRRAIWNALEWRRRPAADASPNHAPHTDGDPATLRRHR